MHPRANTRLRRLARRSRWLALALACCACGTSQPPQPADRTDPATLFGSSTERVALEVDHGADAAPYAGADGRLDDSWSVVRANLEALLPGKVLEVPTTLAELEVLREETRPSYSTDELAALAARHRRLAPRPGLATYQAVFLASRFRDEAGVVRDDVLGLSIPRSSVVVVFKPTIAAIEAGGNAAASRFVEQATLVHELGHAFGLVDDGVPARTPHRDPEHGAHCLNELCVMHHANEGAQAARDLARRRAEGGGLVLFGQECLDDVAALRRAAPR